MATTSVTHQPAPHTITAGQSSARPRDPIPVGLVLVLATIATLPLTIVVALYLAAQMPT